MTTITTATDHGLQIGDNVVIRYNIKFNEGSAETTREVLRKVLSSSSHTTFTVDKIREKVTYWHSINEVGGRKPATEVVSSKLEIDYFNCGPIGGQYQTPESIEILEADSIVNNLNEETDTYSPTTSPTLEEYLAKIAAKQWIVAESSIIRRWMGQIYERSTRLVRAK